MPKCKPKTRFIPATCAWALLIGATSLFFIFPGRCLAMDYYAIPICQGIITIFVLANFSLATFMDPGILPKACNDETRDDDFRVPLYKNVEINGITVRMKWCTTCRFYRPPRCSHCSVCNSCIETFDHHCPWVNNCIGRRNYRHFFLFLVSLSVHMITIFAFCVVFLLKNTDPEKLKEVDTIVCITIMVIIFCLIFPILGLTGFHVVLVSRGRTTNEQVTGKFRGGYNPFSRGCCSNIGYALCGPLYPSYLGRKSKASSMPVHAPPISTIAVENQVRVYMDTSNGVRTANLNAYNKMSQGPNISDMDLTMDTIDTSQSQSQDCEPTPPCPRNGSKTNLFDTAEFREAISSRQNHLPASREPVKVLPSRNPSQPFGNHIPHRSPHPRPRALGEGVRSRSNTPDPLSPESGPARNVAGSPSASRNIQSPGASRTPPSLSSPVRRSSPGTPTMPRSPGFGKRRADFGSPGTDGRPPPGYPVYPDVTNTRQRQAQTPTGYTHTYVPRVQMLVGPDGQEQQRSISPQRKFASESELIRPQAGEHPNPHYVRTGNHTSDNLQDLTGSPVRAPPSYWREPPMVSAYNTHVHHPQSQQPGVHGYPYQRGHGPGQSPSPRGDYWSHPTSPTSGVVGRPPPFSAYGRRNSGSTSPQPKRKIYVQAPLQWPTTHPKDGATARMPARRPMSFVRALEVSDTIEMSPARVPPSPGATPKTEHRLGLQQTISPGQQSQEGDRKSFYDTNYEISV